MDNESNGEAVYSISLSALITMELHSLNNEGGEGNQIATRMVTLVKPDGDVETVNAISGDMLKHIQAAHLHRLAAERGLPLSDGSRMFNPNRINVDVKAAGASLKNKIDPEMIDWMLQRDAISDLEGILITEGKRALGRKSVIEFGWLVGLPNRVRTETFLHTKFVPDTGKGRGSANDDTEGQTESSGSNLGQNLFYRPASSGNYALIVNLEPARIGFNDITQEYAIDDEERYRRYGVLLESALYTLIQPRGAMRNTQNPHIVDCHGVLAWSTQVIPAPTVSPINESFEDEIESIATALNSLRQSQSAVAVHPFASLSELADLIGTLLRMKPFKLTLPRAS